MSWRSLSLILAAALLVSGNHARGLDHQRLDNQIDVQIDAIIDSWTAEERVGQLMLVTFEGSYLGADSTVAQLIRDYNIGGVLLLAANDNINGQVNTPRLVQSLTTDLQQLAYDSAGRRAGQVGTDPAAERAFVPLFIATTHAGNGLPNTQIAWDTTPLPSQMALGATWNPDNAEQVGWIAGEELDAMGVNMLLGPVLDVSQQPQAERTLDLGVDTFGGEPSWVGKMGAAYITGVHEGSRGRIAVIAQNFPGLGLADTDPELQVPVVPRSADELHSFDLIPFYTVTGAALGTSAQADGVQCVNIRYQDAHIRSNTRPVCIDEMAAGSLLRLDYFTAWRDSGIMVSSPLGTHALRRYYNVDPFPHRQVAREAFLAGNDLLYLSDFGSKPGDDQRDNVIDTIKFFAERYEDDPVFRARVNRSLRRLVGLKWELYGGDLALQTVLHSSNDISAVGSSTSSLYAVAQEGVTLLAPRRESLPPPPSREDNIVIFTDVRLVQQCSYCATYPLVSVNALEVAIERMYGPYAGAQVRPEQVVSFSFNQLQIYLDENIANTLLEGSEFKTNQRIGEALHDVDWLVFVMLDISPDVTSSIILRHLLETESIIVENTHVVVIALGAPTYLSSTEISKFTAYYGLYSNTPPYIDAAARALFQENSLPGALPISVPAIGYDVLAMTLPDPAQTLQLEMDVSASTLANAASASEVVTMQVGEQIVLYTLPVLDRNGYPVPDQTLVEFTLTFVTDNLQTRQFGTTLDGVARTTFRPTRPGRVQITASSMNATRSATFQIIVSGEGVATHVSDPTNSAALTGDHAGVSADSLTETAADTSIAAAGSDPGSETGSIPMVRGAASESDKRHRLAVTDFVLAAFALALMGLLGFSAGHAVTHTPDGGVRVVLGSVIAGLTGYIYYGLNGPGAAGLYDLLDNLAPMVITLISGGVGLVYTWWILRRDWR